MAETFILIGIFLTLSMMLVCLAQATPALEKISHSLMRLADNSQHALEAALDGDGPDPECDCEDCTWKRQYSPIDNDDYDPDALDDLDDELSDSGSFFDPDENDRPRKPPKK